MGRKLRVDRSPEEKWQIVQAGIKSGNISETCRRHEISPALFYCWRDEAEQGAKAALGPEGNSYIERFHRSLKEEEVWPAEYRSLEEARASITRWIEEYNHDRPHRGVENRTPHEAFLAFTGY